MYKFIKVLAYLSIIFIGLCCLTFCATCVYTAGKMSEASKPPEVSSPGIVNRYNATQIQPGMTTWQVEKLLGSTYDVQSRMQISNRLHETRIWKDYSGIGTVSVSFIDDKVSSIFNMALD